MTGQRWVKTKVPDNEGRPMDLWERGDYRISQNVSVRDNDGNLVRWDYELTIMVKNMERFVSEHRSLQAAKTAAAQHKGKQ